MLVNSKNTYILSIIASVIIMILGIFIGPHSRSVYDATPVYSDNNFSKISSPESPNLPLATTFSTATVVDNTIHFTAPVYDTYDMEYNDFSGNNHFSDYSIMHYIKSGSNFYYAHDTGAFSSLSSLHNGSVFSLGGQYFAVTNISYYAVAEAKPLMPRITHAGYSSDIALMTCAGTYDYSAGTKTHRLVVYANYL